MGSFNVQVRFVYTVAVTALPQLEQQDGFVWPISTHGALCVGRLLPYARCSVLGGPFEDCYQITACMVNDHSAGRDQWVGEGLCYAAADGQIRLALERHCPVRSGLGAGMAVYSPAWGEQPRAAGKHRLGMGWVGGDI